MKNDCKMGIVISKIKHNFKSVDICRAERGGTATVFFCDPAPKPKVSRSSCGCVLRFPTNMLPSPAPITLSVVYVKPAALHALAATYSKNPNLVPFCPSILVARRPTKRQRPGQLRGGQNSAYQFSLSDTISV
jgi:hypothetical protein